MTPVEDPGAVSGVIRRLVTDHLVTEDTEDTEYGDAPRAAGTGEAPHTVEERTS